MILLDLIQNVALLIALASIYRVFLARLEQNTLRFQVIAGLLFGSAGVVGMMTPLIFMPGIIFDGRSILMSVAGLFGGPLVALIAAILCSAYRIYLGGAGVWVGVAATIQTAAFGVGLFFLRRQGRIRLNVPVLWGFGLLTHAIMLGFMVGLPGGVGIDVLRQVGPFILALYPPVTVLVSVLFLESEALVLNRKSLQENELGLRKAQSVAHVGSWTWHISSNRLEWSDEMYHIFGIDRAYFTGSLADVMASAIHPDDLASVEKSNRAVIENKQPEPLEYRVIWPDGTVRTVWAEAGDLFLDHSGNPALLSGIVQDITERRQAEEALRESENRYRNLILNSPDAIFVNHLGRVILVNHACIKLFGAHSAEDLLGKSPFDLFHPAFHAQIRTRIQQMYALSEPAGLIEEQIVRLDGRVVDVDVIAAPFFFKGANDIHVILRDITERKRMEINLRKNEEYLQSMIACSPLPLISMDMDGKVVTWNPSAERVLGWTAAEVVGKFLPLVPPEKLEEFNGFFQRILAEQGLEGLEVTRLKKDGSQFIAKISAAPIHDTGNQNVGIISFLEDVTDKKHAEDELKQSEERFRAIVEGAPDMIFIQAERKFAYINSKGLTLFGAKQPSDLIGAPVMDRFHPDFHQIVRQRIHMLNEEKLPVTKPLELKFIRLDGSEVWVETTGQPIFYQGRNGALVFARDISERKNAENKIEDQLHELRRWYSSMLGREKRILELKQEVNDLLKQTGMAPRYPSGETQNPPMPGHHSDLQEGP